MNKCFIFLCAILFFVSCRSHKDLSTTKQDTIFILNHENSISYDSVYFYERSFDSIAHDTIYRTNVSWRLKVKYKYLRDTLYLRSTSVSEISSPIPFKQKLRYGLLGVSVFAFILILYIIAKNVYRNVKNFRSNKT